MAKMQRFPYSSISASNGEETLRPHLPILLTYQGRSVMAVGLLDSGSDVNVLPYHIGHELGAIWTEQNMTVKLSGNLAKYQAKGIIISATVGNFAPVKLAFAWTIIDYVPLILGQVNFFMEFDVCFHRNQVMLELIPSKS